MIWHKILQFFFLNRFDLWFLFDYISMHNQQFHIEHICILNRSLSIYVSVCVVLVCESILQLLFLCIDMHVCWIHCYIHTFSIHTTTHVMLCHCLAVDIDETNIHWRSYSSVMFYICSSTHTKSHNNQFVSSKEYFASTSIFCFYLNSPQIVCKM